MAQSIEERVRALLKNWCIEAAEPTNDSTFVDLGFDSLDEIEFIMALEDEFAIEITDEDAAPCKTFGQALALVQRLVEAA